VNIERIHQLSEQSHSLMTHILFATLALAVLPSVDADDRGKLIFEGNFDRDEWPPDHSPSIVFTISPGLFPFLHRADDLAGIGSVVISDNTILGHVVYHASRATVTDAKCTLQ
jgi:hypothetical protein